MGRKNSTKATPEAGQVPASDVAVDVEVPQATTVDQVDPVNATGPADRPTIVVLGNPEALPLLKKVWEQNAPFASIVPVEIGAEPFSLIIDSLLADDIPDEFVLVPANCFPTHRVNMADLIAYRIRRMVTRPESGESVLTPCTGLPYAVDSEIVFQVIEQLGDNYTEEAFLQAYNAIAYKGELPEEIGMSFGNTVSYAIAPPKCMAKVAEALLLKRFISVTADAFAAIKDRLELLVKDEQ